VKLGIDMSSLVGAGGAAAIVLNQTLDLFGKFERYGQMAFDNTIGKAFEYQDAIESLHNTLGLTNADAQRWRSTLIAFDTDIGSFSTSLRYLTQRVSDTGTSGESLRATLRGIGVDAQDATGNYKNASDLMQEILVGLNKVPEGTQRASLEAEIFGRNWHNIAKLINEGTEAVKKFKEQQPLFSDDELERIDKAKTKMDEFNEKMGAIGAKSGAVILENYGISSLLDFLSGSGEYADTSREYEKYKEVFEKGNFKGTFPEWLQNKAALDHSDPIIKTVNAATKLTDKYSGLSEEGLKYQLAADAIAEAQLEYNEALKGTQADLDKASLKLQQAKIDFQNLREEMGKTTSTPIAAKWDSSSVVGTEGSEMQLFMAREMALGTDYETALRNWAMGSGTNATPASGTLAALNGNTGSTVNLGKNARESAGQTAAAPGTAATKTTGLNTQDQEPSKAPTHSPKNSRRHTLPGWMRSLNTATTCSVCISRRNSKTSHTGPPRLR
jgi:hypothetical protein